MMNINANIGALSQERTTGYQVSTGDKQTKKTKAIFMPGETQNPIAKKKAEAFDKARKIVSDAFAGEKKIDEELQELRDLSARLTEENKVKLDEINRNKEEMEELKQTYGVTADSQEQKDLEILMKKSDSRYDPSVSLTVEEQKRYQEILAEGKTEYQTRMMERHDESNRLQREMEENLAAIHANGSVIRYIRGERLKTNPIGEAEDAAQKVIDAAGDEIKAEVVAGAVEHVQEELKEKVEAAEEQAEIREEQKEKLEEVREKSGETEKPIEPEEIVQIQEQIQTEIDKVLEELKLLAEDLKGNAIDKLV